MSLLLFMFNYVVQHPVDDNNIVVLSYVYDSWGKLLSTGGTLSPMVGVQNPFLYKGYYFDFETSLYYCQSRYYNPMWHRWLNADSVDNLNAESSNGLNLFAYCGNNPIMEYDPSGRFVITLATLITAAIIGAISGAVVGGIYGGLTAVANGQNVLAGIGIGVLSGALMGAGAGFASVFIAPVLVGQSILYATVIGANFYMGTTITAGAALAIGTSVAFGTGFAVGMMADASLQAINNGQVNWGSSAWSGVQWGVLNTINAFSCGLAGTGITNMASFALSTIFNSIDGAIGMGIDVLRNQYSNQIERTIIPLPKNELVISF